VPTRRKRPDLTDATYLDRLGAEAARAYAPVIRQQAPMLSVDLPLDDENLHVLFQNTLEALEKQGKIRWSKTPSVRQDVFLKSWYDEMNRLGIRR
jgi:hypothetical protein